MKALITGGAGFIGSHLADLLLKQGYKVRVYDSLEPQVHGNVMRPKYLSENVELVRGDVADRPALLSALSGIDVVIHFAAQVGVGQSQYQISHYTATNVFGTAQLLDILANENHSVRKLLVASSMSIYGEGLYRRPSDEARVSPSLRAETQLSVQDFDVHDSETGEVLQPLPTSESKNSQCESIYALNKRDQEEYCLLFGRTYGIPVVACRFFNTYGSRQSLNNPYTGVAAIFLSRLKNNMPPLIYEDGLQSRDFIDVRDVARACLLVLEDDRANGNVYNVGTGQPVTVLGLARILIELTGKSVEPEITYRYRKGDIRHCFANVDQISRLGFHPEITLSDGLRDLYEWSIHQDAVDLAEKAQSELTLRGLLGGI
jgi:dTDP-L-rhamnose 4-epimerase